MKLTQRIPAAVAATVLIASAMSMTAQQSADVRTKKHQVEVPKTELFLGYSYLRAMPTYADGNRLVWLSGGSASLAYNVTRNLGLVTDFGGYDATQIRLIGPGANPQTIPNAGGTAYTALFGPRFSMRRSEHFTPFVQVLAGGAYATAVNLSTCAVAPCTPLPEQGTFAMTAGGGLDVKLTRHFALRAFQAEYLMTRFENTTTTVRSMQNDIRLSSGIVLRFGGKEHVEPTPVVVVPPVVMPVNHAPVVVCSADRKTVRTMSGHPVMLQAMAADADGDTLSYAWSANEGSLASTTDASVAWSLEGVSAGDHVAKVHVEDGRGGMADCSVLVTAEVPPVVKAELSPEILVVQKRLSLHSIYFPTAEPTVEHPDGGLLPSQRATLVALANDFATYSAAVPEAKLVLEGHADPRGSEEYNELLSQRRVEASKQFLVEHGVPATSIEVKAAGERHNLTDEEVADAVDHNDELTESERATLHKNMTVIILASNRRVDIVLSPAGEHSARKFPFNAKDSMALISATKPQGRRKGSR